MADPEHLELLRFGAQYWNVSRPKWPELQNIDFSDADFSGYDLDGANFSECSLARARLRDCKLRGAFFSRAKLVGADLSGSNAYYARFVESDLRQAVLAGTKLTGATLDGAKLEGANLTGAEMMGAQMRMSDLRGACLASTVLMRASFMHADLTGADLRRSVLIGATFVQTVIEAALFDDAIAYGVSAWDLVGKPASSDGLVLSPSKNVTVSDLKMAQFIYLMIENRNVRDALDSITSKVVLLLGRFTPARKQVLDRLRDALQSGTWYRCCSTSTSLAFET